MTRGSSLEPAAPYRAVRSTAAAWRLAVESEDPSGSSHLLLIAGKEAGGRQMTADRFLVFRMPPISAFVSTTGLVNPRLRSRRSPALPMQIPPAGSPISDFSTPSICMAPGYHQPPFSDILPGFCSVALRSAGSPSERCPPHFRLTLILSTHAGV